MVGSTGNIAHPSRKNAIWKCFFDTKSATQKELWPYIYVSLYGEIIEKCETNKCAKNPRVKRKRGVAMKIESK